MTRKTRGGIHHGTGREPETDLTERQREACKQNEGDLAELDQEIKRVHEAARARLRNADREPGEYLWYYLCTQGLGEVA